MTPLGDSHRSKEVPKAIFRLRGQGARIISVYRVEKDFGLWIVAIPFTDRQGCKTIA